MAAIYALSRDGGPRSPRFAAYRACVEHDWGLSAYNPMAGAAALEAVQALLALDAEVVARESGTEVARRCEFEEDLMLAVVVASKGMWTDRLATEVQHRTFAERRAGHGLVLLWAGEQLDVDAIRRECAAETVRTMWTALHGPASVLGDVLAREGLAYALAREPSPYGDGDDGATVEEAIAVLGDSATQGDVVGVLYGDAAAIALGHTPLGLADTAGYRWAIAHARRAVERLGAREALVAGRALASGLHRVP